MCILCLALVVQDAAKSVHCLEVVVVQSDFSWFPGSALALAFGEIGTEHRLKHRRGAREDNRGDPEARLLEYEDHISLDGDIDVDNLGWLRSFGG